MSSRPARILVVDDAPLTRGLLEHALRKYGYAVETASNGQQAVEYFIPHQRVARCQTSSYYNSHRLSGTSMD